MGPTHQALFPSDGRPAFPIPDDLEETDILTLATVVPSGSQVVVEVSNCLAVQLGRVRGSFADASRALHEKSDGESDFAGCGIVETGEFRCSEELEASVQNHIPTRRTSGVQYVLKANNEIDVPLDEVFFLTVGVGLVFDLGRPTVTSLQDRPIEGMPMATQKYVAQRNDFSGLRPVITVGAHPCGANPRSWRACDMFSPTLVIDPTRIRDGFGLGLNLTAPWFGILVAANMYESEVLTKGTNIEVGDAWTVPGDLPTSKVFDRNSFGVFIGVSMTTDLFRAVVGRRE